jgi:hypothetical protein
MSVRATNVYEERSLGIFGDREEQEETEEPQNAEIFSKYLGWHIRHQLSFDIWWLAAALLILNIIEVCTSTQRPCLGAGGSYSTIGRGPI